MVICAEEFTAYIDLYKKLVFSICLSFTKNYFDAEDLTQETFLSAYRKIDSFDGRNFQAWITTIAANKCKNHLASPKQNVKLVSDELLETIPSDNDSPEAYILADEQAKKIYLLCCKLKQPYKTVAIKYFCENVKLSEYAKQTGKNLKTLQTQLYRAKKALAELWKEEEHVSMSKSGPD